MRRTGGALVSAPPVRRCPHRPREPITAAAAASRGEQRDEAAYPPRSHVAAITGVEGSVLMTAASTFRPLTVPRQHSGQPRVPFALASGPLGLASQPPGAFGQMGENVTSGLDIVGVEAVGKGGFGLPHHSE